MAVTYTTPPPVAAYSGDGIYVGLDTDLVFASSANFEITVTGTPADGEELTLSWTGGDVTYTATDPAAGDPTEWPLRAAGQTDNEYAADLRDFLDDGGLLSAVFAVTVSDNIITIGALTPGDWALSVDADSMTGIAAVANDVVETAAPDNLALVVRVHSAGVGADDVAGTELLATQANVDLSTTTLLDIHAAFAHLAPFLPEDSSIILADAAPPGSWYYDYPLSMYQRYYLRYGERYGIPGIVQGLFISADEYSALLGAHSGAAIDPDQVARVCHDYNRRDGEIFRKPVSRDQPDWTYIWTADFIGSPTAASLSVYLHWSDGTFSTYTPFGSGMPTLEAQRLYVVATGYNQLRLQLAAPSGATDPDAYIVAYAVRIGPQDDGFAYLAEIFYDVAPICHDWNLYVLFVNGVGGLETAWLRGKAKETYPVDATEYQRVRWGTSRPADFRDYDNLDALGRPAWQVSTGWYADQFYLVHLRQMPLGRAWLIDMVQGRFLPITVEGTDSAVSMDDDTLHELTFTLRAGWYDDAANL